MQLSQNAIKYFSLLSEHGKLTLAKLTAESQVTSFCAYNAMARYIQRGMVQKTDVYRGYYSLTDQGYKYLQEAIARPSQQPPKVKGPPSRWTLRRQFNRLNYRPMVPNSIFQLGQALGCA